MRRSILFLTAFLLFALVAQAAAAEISRDEYRERVEPICKVNTEANERILSGVRKRVKAGELDKAAKQFSQAAAALKKTRTALLAVPMPSADQAKLTKWLADVKTEVTLLEGIGRALAKNDKHTAQRLVTELTTNANKTNAEVVSFEFTYCWFQPAKYT